MSGCCCNSEVLNNIQNNVDSCGCNMERNDDNCCERMRIRKEMMEKIKCLDFAIIELALYLDTHPQDERALCLHREYTKEVKELKDKYQKVYGPLTINYPCNMWRWLEEPWPSFILGVTTYLQFFSLSNKKN